MVNKRGWIRIVEAMIAIMIILASALIVINKNKTEKQDDSGCDQTTQYLNELSKIDNLRYAVITSNITAVDNFFKTRIDNPLLNYDFNICNLEDSCLSRNSPSDNVDICADSRIISSSKDAPNGPPKRIKLFLFQRS